MEIIILVNIKHEVYKATVKHQSLKMMTNGNSNPIVVDFSCHSSKLYKIMISYSFKSLVSPSLNVDNHVCSSNLSWLSLLKIPHYQDSHSFLPAGQP